MSPQLFNVLRLLGHDRFMSGEAIAQQLGCSRGTIHNALQSAREVGVTIHSISGRGYRLADALVWLRPEWLAQQCERIGLRLEFFEHLPSTNSYLLEQARLGAPHGTVALAEWQTQGRGRRGRTWLAPMARSLAFSMLWRSTRPVAELSGLSLAVGAIIAQSLREMGLGPVQVKWPNDVLVHEQKLAGILIELSGDVLGPSAAVIGVGLNIEGGASLSHDVGQPVTDLFAHLGPVDRNEVFVALMKSLGEGLSRFEKTGFSGFLGTWNELHAYQGRSVSLLASHGEPTVGQVVGVDESGALLLRTASGVQRFHSGEVSLRGSEA